MASVDHPRIRSILADSNLRCAGTLRCACGVELPVRGLCSRYAVPLPTYFLRNVAMASVRLCSRRGDVRAALLVAASCWCLFTSTLSVLATAVHLPSAGSTSASEVMARRQLVSSVSVTASQTTPSGVTVVATLAEPGNIWCTVQAASLTAGATPPFELVRSVGTKFTGGVAGANSLSFDPVEGGGGTMIAYCVTKDSATKTESPVGASETFLFGTIALVHAPMCACVCARALHPDSGSRPLRAHRLGRP